LININASPYLAVGNGAIELTRVELKDFAVRTFGTYDKLVLLSGMVLVLAAAVAGLLSLRSRWPGVVVIAAFGLVGAVAVYERPDLTAVALLAPLASLVVGVGVFVWLHRVAPRVRRSAETGEKVGTPRRCSCSAVPGSPSAPACSAAASCSAAHATPRPPVRRSASWSRLVPPPRSRRTRTSSS
jgi:hypothetical protein